MTQMLTVIGPSPRLRLYTTFRHYAAMAAALIGGTINRGGDVERLQAEIARRHGVAGAVAMPMARVGLYAAVKALVRPGQRVIMSPYTIADVVSMVVAAGGIPAFADIERGTCNLDPARVAGLLDGDTGAVLATHFYGLMCDMPRILEIASAAGVPVIEDAAQAFGARLGGRPAGSFGRAGVFSFGLYKNVNAFRGGMVISDDAALCDTIVREVEAFAARGAGELAADLLRGAMVDTVTHPALFRPLFFRLFRLALLHDWDAINNRLKIDVAPTLVRSLPQAYRRRMSDAQARLILSQLDRVEEDTRRRVRTAQRYHEGLSDLPELLLPPLRDDGSHVYWYYPIQYDDRDALVRFAARQGRDITASYHRNCAGLPCFAEFGPPCPNAEATANALIYLPTYPRFDDREVDATIRVIRRFFGR